MKQKTEIYIGIIMFAATLVLASYQNWSVTEIIWSLWISSLLLGYAYILTAILGMLLHGDSKGLLGGTRKNIGKNTPAVAMNVFFLVALFFIFGFSQIVLVFFILVVCGVLFSLGKSQKQKLGLDFLPDSDHFISRFIAFLPSALFMLGFFTFHFVFFHFIHSLFLNSFFPIVEGSPFGEDISGTGIYFLTVIKESGVRFWPFIVMSGFSRLRLYARAFSAGGDSAMLIPYKNVVRMHLTIFAMAFLYAADLVHYGLYLVLFLYFLPVKKLAILFFKKKTSKQIQNSI